MSENNVGDAIGTFFLIMIVIGLTALLIGAYLIYRVVIMFYDFNKYKYNLLIVLLTTVTLVVLDRFTEISNFAIGLTGFITAIVLLILSHYPLSNSANPSNAKPSNATKSNNVNKKNK